MNEVYYEGRRSKAGCRVERVSSKGRQALPRRQDLWDHSPTGFEWGYGGSGPAQLALALLADVLRNDDVAIELHQAYKWAVICQLDKDRWTLTAASVAGWAASHDQVLVDEVHQAGDDDSGIDLARAEEECNPGVEEAADLSSADPQKFRPAWDKTHTKRALDPSPRPSPAD